MARLNAEARRIEKEKKSWQRKQNTRNERKMLIIACEDTKSSRLYFEAIFKDLKKNRTIAASSLVIAEHIGTQPSKVLEALLSHQDYEKFDHRWIVIDRDEARTGVGIQNKGAGGHSETDFNTTLAKAKKNKPEIEVAYANPCFEIWVLLHFESYGKPIHRDVLEQYLRRKYQYSKKELFVPLFDLKLQATAIANSKQLIQSWVNSQGETIPVTDNPSTTIHELVELLNSFKD